MGTAAKDVFWQDHMSAWQASGLSQTACCQQQLKLTTFTYWRHKHDFPAQHRQRIRTSNPIESTFATMRHRTKRSKGCLTRNGILHEMFKLGQCAQKNWRRQRGFNYLAKVIAEVKFRDGIEVTESNQITA